MVPREMKLIFAAGRIMGQKNIPFYGDWNADSKQLLSTYKTRYK